ncbi:efflux RND transporter periplasmic adaptor subunit [Dethiothermospora halolimnae]|uniref:efflux RND transporter periplasmic adaptor subunit n=1 Tax=Dethiothermospora halolimnae TaxID=3114390 RepID=UPI003CCC1AD9
MNKKFMLLICSVVVLILFLYGCKNSTNTTGVKNVKTVETMVLSPSKYDVKLDYQGIVRPSKIRKYFFKSSGKVSKVNVQEGQYVKKGDVLATLDTTHLKYSYASTKSNLAIAKNTLEKTRLTYDTNIRNAGESIKNLKQQISVAQSNLDVLKSKLEASEELYKAGAISQMDIEGQRAQYTKSKNGLESLCSQLETAKANLEKLKKDKINDVNTAKENVKLSRNSKEQAEKNIIDANLKAEADGYITTVGISEGDFVTANSPIITAKSNSSQVSIGVSAEDHSKLSSVKKVIINNSTKGEIDNISIYPDEATHTYTVDIIFDSNNMIIGEIVDVDLVLDSAEGVFVPMESVININGVHYVYKLNDDNTVSRVQIDIKEISEGKMLVSNLSDEKIVTTGVKTLNENDIVSEISQADSYGQNGGGIDD